MQQEVTLAALLEEIEAVQDQTSSLKLLKATRDAAISLLRAGTKPVNTDIVDFVARVDISDIQ